MALDFILFAIAFIFVGLIINIFAVQILGIEKRYNGAIFAGLFFRMGLCFFYYYYFSDKSADATRYYAHAREMNFEWSRFLQPGTEFIKNLSSFFSLFIPELPNSYLMLYVPFGLCGHIGSLLFFRLCLSFEYVSERLKLIIPFFLPNLIFWTSNLGKDSIVFMGLLLVFYGYILFPSITGRLIRMIPGFLIVFSVRPHIAAVLLMSIFFGLIVRSVKIDFKTLALSAIVTIGFVLSYERVFNYVGLEVEIESDDDAIGVVTDVYDKSIQNIESRAGSLNYGGSSTGERKLSIAYAPLYFINFLAGPFIWQARKPMQFVAAFESLIYLFAIIYIIKNWALYRRNKTIEFKYTWVFFVLLASTVMGMSFTNYVLTTRQKCMVIPALMIIYLVVVSEKKSDAIVPETEDIDGMHEYQ